MQLNVRKGIGRLAQNTGISYKVLERKLAYQAMKDAGFKGETNEPSAGYGAAVDRFIINFLKGRCNENGEHEVSIYEKITSAVPFSWIDMTSPEIRTELKEILDNYRDNYLADLENSKNKTTQ